MVGHIPFLHRGVLYPWSQLDPGSVQLRVAVMPDSQHLLDKDRITASAPRQGKVYTVFSPRSFRCVLDLQHFHIRHLRPVTTDYLRTTMSIHRLITHLCVGVEGKLRVWRYLLPPGQEKDGHEIQGQRPVWQPVKKTDHLICATGKHEPRTVQRKHAPLPIIRL